MFAAYEGYRIDTAWRLVWSAMMTVLTRQTSAVPLPALGIGRRRDKGARCGARLRPPLIGAPVTHWNSDANKLLDIAQEADILTVAQRDRDTFSTRARRTADTLTPSTSMPRAAISVATSVLTSPLRKAASTRSRWFCDLLP